MDQAIKESENTLFEEQLVECVKDESEQKEIEDQFVEKVKAESEQNDIEQILIEQTILEESKQQRYILSFQMRMKNLFIF
jgi:hypothetical protein